MKPRVIVVAVFSVVTAAVLIGVAVITLSAGKSTNDGAASTKLGASGLPTAESATAQSTLSYLEADGSQLLLMHEATSDLALLSRQTVTGIGPKIDADTCTAKAQALDEDIPSDRVIELLPGVTDEPLRAAFSDERSALGVALTTCITGDMTAATDRVGEALKVAELVTLRLNELKAVR